ncbi:hypothetical protein N7527_006496 [Penicillium freii]|nr:hypothetical protein N7527_006496 [Penicillium freii]
MAGIRPARILALQLLTLISWICLIDEAPDRPFFLRELPSSRVCEYLEDLAEEIEVAKRCGKPYSNTVEADRFALSVESLRQSQASVRVTAGIAIVKWLVVILLMITLKFNIATKRRL